MNTSTFLRSYFIAEIFFSFYFDEKSNISQICAIFAENIIATARKTSQCTIRLPCQIQGVQTKCFNNR